MTAVDAIRSSALRLRGDPSDHDELLDRVDDARLVLIGEASHGTHEFYRERATITARLIAEKGFVGVAAEADWPDAYRLHRYLMGRSDDADAVEALGGFRRFPAWMWRNADVLDYVGWCRSHNDALAGPEHKAGFWGLDLYSLRASMTDVITHLDRVDPAAAARARERYACFDRYGDSTEAYGLAASLVEAHSCEKAAVEQLLELQRRRSLLGDQAGLEERLDAFVAEQNARVASHAEAYYRAMFRADPSSWNLRDQHMAETLEALLAHLDQRVGRAKLVVWAHNSHLGDARATDMRRRGELSLGQLVRQRFGHEALIVGFTTYEGSVTAVSRWEAPSERKQVRPALPGSHEALFHATGLPRFALFLGDETPARAVLAPERLQRFIGVIYRPDFERESHYMLTQLTGQYDVVIHLDQTRAVEPLEREGQIGAGWEPPETYPSAL